MEYTPKVNHGAVFWNQHPMFIKRMWDRYGEVHEATHGPGLTLDATTWNRAERDLAAVESGQWLLYRYDPRRADKGENPLQLDSSAAKAKVQDYLLSENRFKMLTKSKPEDAKKDL